MKLKNTEFSGVYLIEGKLFKDERGGFMKIFQRSILQNAGINPSWDEHFLSVSHKGVIRGMHFQNPPFQQSKLVYVARGKVFDVIIDLRKNSNTYSQIFTINLSGDDQQALFIPEGFAHGFQSLYDNTIMIYLQSHEFKAEADSGISPLSIVSDWPIKDYIISEKDNSLIPLAYFKSPF